MDNAVLARYYDGRTTRPQEVRLAVVDGRLSMRGEDFERLVPVEHLRVGQALGSAPRRIDFPSGSHCEVGTEHLAGLEVLLAQLGFKSSRVAHWQSRTRHAVAALAITLAVLGAGYRWGLPLGAELAARQIPPQAAELMDTHSLRLLDEVAFGPTRLPEAQRNRIIARFDALATPDGAAVPHHIVFRDGGKIGANALALPGGTIVVTDQLVKLADDDEQVLGVLAHELGHVRGRHSLRQLLQTSVVGMVVAWYTGDASSLLATVPTVLLDTKYSRDFEREADAYSAAMMSANHIPPERLATLLDKLEKEFHPDGKVDGGSLEDYFSTHPNTGERIKRLRQGS